MCAHPSTYSAMGWKMGVLLGIVVQFGVGICMNHLLLLMPHLIGDIVSQCKKTEREREKKEEKNEGKIYMLFEF